jgi:hypothetical protein
MVADTPAQLADPRELSSQDEALYDAVLSAHARLEAMLDELNATGVFLDAAKLRELHAFIGQVALPIAEDYERSLASTCANCGGSMGARTGWLCELCKDGGL